MITFDVAILNKKEVLFNLETHLFIYICLYLSYCWTDVGIRLYCVMYEHYFYYYIATTADLSCFTPA